MTYSNADFTPGLKGYSDIKPFRFWCQKVLPLVYDDSLSYYELLCKVTDYINNIITDLATTEENVAALLDAYNQLQSYVNNYFTNLDVQEEINNKLDAMFEDGTIPTMIEEYVYPYIETLNNNYAQLDSQINETMTTQNENIATLTTRVNNLVINNTTNLTGYDVVTVESTTAQGGSTVTENIPVGAEILQVCYSGYNDTNDTIKSDNISYKSTPNVPTSTQQQVVVTITDATDTRFNVFITYAISQDIEIAELTDIRVGYDDTVYSSAGNAVRGQVGDIWNNLNNKADLPYTVNTVTLTIQDGYYTASGFSASSSFKSAKEAVNEGETILLTGSGNTFAYAYYFVNNNGTVISKADTALEMNDYKVIVPNGATYVEINNSSTNKNVSMKRINYNNTFDMNSLIDTVDYAADNVVEPITEEEELSPTWESGYRINGATISPNDAYRTTIIPVTSGEVYNVIIYFKESWFYGVYLYDSNMSLVSRYITGDGTTQRYEQQIPITTTGYMVVNAAAWNYYRGIFKVLTISGNDRVSMLEKTPWAGKTIWWCGTSIPAMSAPIEEENLSYPAYVGKLLGATIINKAIPSSCARRGWKNKESISDPYGWTDVAWQNVFLAMGANLTEKQDLIDNYNTWKNIIGGDFPSSGDDGTGTGKPETLTQEWIDKIKASSYENILIPYLDGTYDMPDLFVFDHGHNDYGYGETAEAMESAPVTSYDMSTFIGAMSFYFEKIFVANPQAKIVIISHYANNTTKENTICTSQNNLADLWDLPIFDSYKKLGWSQQVVTTTGYWDQTTFKWVNSGGTEQQITMLQMHIRDGVHPSSDQSGKAIVQYGNEIALYLKNNIDANKV